MATDQSAMIRYERGVHDRLSGLQVRMGQGSPFFDTLHSVLINILQCPDFCELQLCHGWKKYIRQKIATNLGG